MNFAKPDQKRHKIVAILLAVAGIVLVWQLYERFAKDKIAMHQPAKTVTSATLLAQQEKAAKTEAALTATPDNPTAPAKTVVAEASKVIAKPVKYNSLPSLDKQVNTVQPAVINVINEPMPTAAKNARSLLPLEQPMVAFPKHKETAEQPKAVKTAVTVAPVVIPAVVTPVKPAPAKVTPATPAATPTPAANTDAEANVQVLTTNPNYYTIQLTSDHELANLQQFVKKHNLQNKTIYFRTVDRKNRELHILIYGTYTNSADAKAALAKLPDAAKAEGAFVVKYSTIQTVLKKSASVNK